MARVYIGQILWLVQAVEDKLYVIGGVVYEDDGDQQNAKSVEMYDAFANQWTVVLDDAIEDYGFSSFAVENMIYMFGGDTSAECRVFDIEKRKVSKLAGKLPSNCLWNISAFMVLPQLL